MFRRFKSYSTRKKLSTTFLLFLLICMISIFTANRVIIAAAEGKTFGNVTEIPYNKTGLLLGTSRLNGRGEINAFYAFRIEAAVKLFRAGKIRYILISGDNSTAEYDEPTTMKNDLIARGIPASRIYLDFAGFRTLDSMERALKVFGQKKITVISQKFHNERAIYLGEALGIETIGFNARDVRQSRGLKTAIRERFARVKVFIDLWTGAEAKFLGDPVAIGA